MSISITENRDCIEAMREFPDGFFDLAVVDPPYGDAGENRNIQIGYGGNYGGRVQNWNIAPPPQYFDELFRVSKNQIIFGGNYFPLPPSRCWIVWHKTNIPDKFTMSPVELAWTSFNQNAKIYEGTSVRRKDSAGFHACEKPIALYKWVFAKYAQSGYKILDTHLGSGSSRIAAHDAGLDFWGYEINKEYFELEKARFDAHTLQTRIEFD